MKGEFTNNKIELIQKITKGKTVLDCGCVGCEFKEGDTRWLHEAIEENAREVLGVDSARDEVEKLRTKGYNIIYGNIEKIELHATFDVIVASELLEHLHNAGNFLENVRKYLEEDGIFLLSTPNVFSFRSMFYTFFRGKLKPNPEHTCYFDYFTLEQLLSSHGFKIEELFYFGETKSTWKRRIIMKILFRLRPSFAETIVIIARKINSGSSATSSKSDIPTVHSAV